MKKLLFFIATAIAFASCGSDDCDHMATNDTSSNNSIVGSWYEESENEEIRYHENGKFYDKYCTIKRSGETEGTYEYNSNTNKLTWTYSFMGQTQMSDWTVKSLTDFSLTIYSSTVAEHKMEKIVESYTLSVGEAANIQFSQVYPSYTVSSYTSLSPRIASVTSDGTITAEGEKGTAYIKIATSAGNVWAKVIVGDDCLDLWYDYPTLIGADYTQIKNTLGTPSVTGTDGYSYEFNISDYHDFLSKVDIFLNTKTGKGEEIVLVLKESSSESQILAYLKSHYYENTELGENYYTTCSSKDSSVGIVYYDKSNKVIRYYDTDAYLYSPIVADFNYTLTFGYTTSQIVNAFGALYYDILPMYSVSSEYVKTIYFNIDEKTDKVTAYQLTLQDGVDTEVIHSALSYAYNYYKANDENTQFAYRDGDSAETSKVMIVFNKEKNVITYYDLEYYGK